MNMEFEKVKDKIDKVEINKKAARENVCKIEQCKRKVKEQSWGTISEMQDMGFKIFHKIIIVHIIYFVVNMLNAMPVN